MLYFRTKPDPVFSAIFYRALEFELHEIGRISSEKDFDAWEAGYGNICERFTPYSALVSIEELLVASRKDQVYQLGDYHWLLIYECLKNFCAIHEDLAMHEEDGSVTIEEFRLHQIDFQGIVDLYFWDTDFLVLPDQDSIPEVCGNFPNVDSLCQASLTTGLQPHPRYLRLISVNEPTWRLPQLYEFYGQHSRCYPDFN